MNGWCGASWEAVAAVPRAASFQVLPGDEGVGPALGLPRLDQPVRQVSAGGDEECA